MERPPWLWIIIGVVSFAVAGLLLVRIWHIRALVLSGQVRHEATVVMNGLREQEGVPRSFFVVKHIGCGMEHCELVMREQWNLVTVRAPLQTLHASWQVGAPEGFTWSYANQ